MYICSTKLLIACLLLYIVAGEARYQPQDEEVNNYVTGLLPEAYMTADKLITSKNIPFEHYYVETSDGYILEMHRLARPDSNQTYPILLIPGLMGSSETFLMMQRDQSLAYVLYDRGFDVFLGNARGTRYARNHTTFNTTQEEFWDFSFDEIGKYDVPALVDRVLEVTDKSKVNFVGYSEGTAVLVSAVIQNHDELFGTKIDKFFALGPAIYVKHSTANLKNFRATLVNMKYYAENKPEYKISKGEFHPMLPSKRKHMVTFMKYFPTSWSRHFIDRISGKGDAVHHDGDRLATIWQRELYSTSTKNVEHWLQMFDKNSANLQPGMSYFRASDETILGRDDHSVNHDYDFSLFDNVPTYFFCGDADAVVTLEDCKASSKIVMSLQGEVEVFDGMAHLDFVYSPLAATTVYNKIIKHIETDENPYN